MDSTELDRRIKHQNQVLLDGRLYQPSRRYGDDPHGIICNLYEVGRDDAGADHYAIHVSSKMVHLTYDWGTDPLVQLVSRTTWTMDDLRAPRPGEFDRLFEQMAEEYQDYLESIREREKFCGNCGEDPQDWVRCPRCL